MIEMGVDPSTIKKEDILARYFYDGKPDYRAISKHNTDYGRWKSRPKPDEITPTISENLVEQPDGTVRPGADKPEITDTAKPETTDEVNVLPGVGDTFTGGGSQPAPTPTPTPPASRPGINIVPGVGGDFGITIDGKTPGQLILGSKPGQTIVNQLPPVLTTGPGTFPMPTGTPTHINTGGTGGFGGTGIGVLAPVAGGQPMVYGTWAAHQVADLLDNPFGVLSNMGQRWGESIGSLWSRLVDLFGIDKTREGGSQRSSDPNTLTNQIERMVSQSLPFVPVTGEDGQPNMYDKATGQTLSLSDYMALVERGTNKLTDTMGSSQTFSMPPAIRTPLALPTTHQGRFIPRGGGLPLVFSTGWNSDSPFGILEGLLGRIKR